MAEQANLDGQSQVLGGQSDLAKPIKPEKAPSLFHAFSPINHNTEAPHRRFLDLARMRNLRFFSFGRNHTGDKRF